MYFSRVVQKSTFTVQQVYVVLTLPSTHILSIYIVSQEALEDPPGVIIATWIYTQWKCIPNTGR